MQKDALPGILGKDKDAYECKQAHNEQFEKQNHIATLEQSAYSCVKLNPRIENNLL